MEKIFENIEEMRNTNRKIEESIDQMRNIQNTLASNIRALDAVQDIQSVVFQMEKDVVYGLRELRYTVPDQQQSLQKAVDDLLKKAMSVLANLTNIAQSLE